MYICVLRVAWLCRVSGFIGCMYRKHMVYSVQQNAYLQVPSQQFNNAGYPSTVAVLYSPLTSTPHRDLRVSGYLCKNGGFH